MSAGKVICPKCGAENIDSPIITLCSQCLGSLKGARKLEAGAAAAPAAPERAPAEAPPAPPPAPPPERVICPRCRAANPPDYHYCAVCGAPMPVAGAPGAPPGAGAPLVCPRCHQQNEAGRIFCQSCGFDLRLRLEEVEGKPWSPPPHAPPGPGELKVHFARERAGGAAGTKTGACCGCLVLWFIFVIAMMVINAGR